MAVVLFGAVHKLPVLLFLAFILGTLYYLILCIFKYWARSKLSSEHGCKPPPRYPVRDPLFGLDVIYNSLRAVKRRTFMSEIRSQYEVYGSTHSSRLATLPVIMTIEPENIKTVLSTKFKDYVVGTPRRRAFSPIMANSILVADGDEWEHSRAFLKPSFQRNQVGDLGTLETHVQNLIEAIPQDGSTVDLAELFLRYTADVTTDFMFGESILSLPQPKAFGGDLTRACREAQLGAERRFRLGVFANIVPQRGFYRSVRQLHTYMDAHVEKAIRQSRLPKDSEKNGELNQSRFVFSKALAEQTDDRLVLRDQLLGIFFAGRDTTAALLSNLFFVLARSSKTWKQLQDEINALGGRPPTLDELKGLKYLGHCLNESMTYLAQLIESQANQCTA